MSWKISTFEKAIEALTQHGGDVMHNISEHLITADLCKFAVQQDGLSLGYVPYCLLTYELCKLAVQQNGASLDAVPDELRTAELCKLALQQDPSVLLEVPYELRTYELCKLAVEHYWWTLRAVPYELRTSELCKLAFQKNIKASEFIPEHLLYITMKVLTPEMKQELIAAAYYFKIGRAFRL